MAIEIVDFPINSMVIFHCFLYVHQRVIFEEQKTKMFRGCEFFSTLPDLPGKVSSFGYGYRGNPWGPRHGVQFQTRGQFGMAGIHFIGVYRVFSDMVFVRKALSFWATVSCCTWKICRAWHHHRRPPWQGRTESLTAERDPPTHWLFAEQGGQSSCQVMSWQWLHGSSFSKPT